ncbi:(2R-3R)-2-3-butanediol dehydrogenase [Kluyveromyces marxianus]|uniref:(2R-3R)-2-3-butanediol dehydrogenase n=1 Tax=Kluyveromyces marxianus TaxID=4911 RepID=A0ABX6EWG5_KLUMA|nr:(2R-3R)-2-3-butanediol dehydrogenase [Kluyveromyces marxianus]
MELKAWGGGEGGGGIGVMPSIVYKKMYVGNVTKQGTWFLEEYPYVLELVRTQLHFCVYISIECSSNNLVIMRALAYFGKKDIKFTNDLKEPTIGVDDEVEINVAWCGICGSDLHEYLDGPIFFPEDGKTHDVSGLGLPQAMGHEMSGIVSKVGSKVKNVKPGDRVVVEATGSCLDHYRWEGSAHAKDGNCAACSRGYYNCCAHLGFMGLGVHSGGFAEKVVISERHIVKIPDSLPLDVAALVEPISVSWHAVRISHLQEGQSALVLGAGPIGLATILALQGHGASKIVVSEPAEIRRRQAAKLGVETFNPMEHGDDAVEILKKMAPGGEGFDFAYDCSGVKATFDTGVHAVTFRGMYVNIAIWGHKPIDFRPMDVTLQEKFITGSMCYTVEDFKAVVAAFADGRIEVDKARHLITGKQKIEDGFEKGFDELMNHKEKNIKILLTPNNHGELNAN